MAKFINKKEEVIQMDLTAYGKHKFSRGEFTPAFYTFHDDDIMYDSGLGLATYDGFNEEQNNIVSRIKEAQRLENIVHFTSSIGGSSDATTNISNTTYEDVNPATKKYFRTLGTSSPWEDYMPSWDIKCLETGTPFSGTLSYKSLGIPTLTSSLNLEYSVSTISQTNDEGESVDIQIYDLERSDKILLDINEINTILKSNGNFDIEVYKITSGEQGSEKLTKLDFINTQSSVGESLKAQENIEVFAQYLNGDEEEIQRNFPIIGPDFVEYYLSVRVDDEIDLDKPIEGDTLYKSGKVVGPEEC
mgnify:FL=1|jgi:hypothetical protein